MSDIATKQEIIEDVEVENCEKYEAVDKITSKNIIKEILVEYEHVFEELAKWKDLH